MSANATNQAHIAYELIDQNEPKVIVVEFLSRSIIDPGHAHDLGEQLRSLMRSDLPRRFVIDFSKVRMLGSRAFGEIASFARDIRRMGGRVAICEIPGMMRLGAALVGLEDVADFVADRGAAIERSLEPADMIFGDVHR
jgi:anti-anti-sigma regulatory factor